MPVCNLTWAELIPQHEPWQDAAWTSLTMSDKLIVTPPDAPAIMHRNWDIDAHTHAPGYDSDTDDDGDDGDQWVATRENVPDVVAQAIAVAHLEQCRQFEARKADAAAKVAKKKGKGNPPKPTPADPSQSPHGDPDDQPPDPALLAEAALNVSLETAKCLKGKMIDHIYVNDMLKAKTRGTSLDARLAGTYDYHLCPTLTIALRRAPPQHSTTGRTRDYSKILPQT